MNHEHWVMRTGRWLTKRRGILLAPLFVVALASARFAANAHLEWIQDITALISLLGGTWLRLVAASYHESEHGRGPISAGPYAWIRHPLYVSNFLIGFGIVLVAGWWPMIVVYILFFLPLHALIMWSEEIHLTGLYGEQYRQYLKSIPAVLPWRRYRGERRGHRNQFKLKRGQEWLKAMGYLMGLAVVLAFKQWRSWAIQTEIFMGLHPLSWKMAAGAVTIAVLMIVYRSKARWAWLRSCQTAVTVVCVLFLALHVPGVWVETFSSFTSESSSKMIVASVVPQIVTSQQPVSIPEAPVLAEETSPVVNTTSPSRWFRIALWNNVEAVSGITTFVISGVIEDAFEKNNSSANHEFGEALQRAIMISMGTKVAKQLTGLRRAALLPSPEERWQFRLSPALADDGHVKWTAVFKRRF